jgi:hypothetical protein
MGVNQNLSQELGIYSEIDPTPSLLTPSRPQSYQEAIGPRNRISNHNGNTNRYRQEHERH